MARESKRKRDGRRFGTPERLADAVITTPPRGWLGYRCFAPAEAVAPIENIRSIVASCPVVVADNVSRYYWENPQEYWTYKSDFPCVSPPFPAFLVEFAVPAVIVRGSRVERYPETNVSRQGVLLEYIPSAGKKFPRPGGNRGDFVHDFDQVELPGAAWFVRALPLFVSRTGRPIYTSMIKYFAVNGSGVIVEDPALLFTGPVAGDPAEMSAGIGSVLNVALLTVCFAHCKNVVLAPHDPDPALNRERRKGGLKPFVRYHTIDIEPMKRVLRDEGGVESHGLKKALHIVRGHFARYSEDRPLFGKYPGTFWMPAHVRGSIKEGVVVSDYDVKPPAPEGA